MCFLWMESLWCFNNIKMMFFWRKHHERVPRASFWKDLTPSIPIPPALPQGLGQMFQLRSWCVVFPAWIGRFDLLGVVLIIRLTLPIYIYTLCICEWFLSLLWEAHLASVKIHAMRSFVGGPNFIVDFFWFQCAGGALNHSLSGRKSSIATWLDEPKNDFWAISIADWNNLEPENWYFSTSKSLHFQ